MDLETIAFTGEEENVGGIVHTDVWLIDRKLLDTLEDPPALDTAAGLAEAATIAVAHVPAANEGFRKIEVVPKTGNIESTLAGETGGKVYNNVFAFGVKTNSAKVLGVCRWAKNRELVAICKEVGGPYRQIGSKEIPAELAELTASLGGGGHDGRKMVNFSISDTQAWVAPIYDAAIPEPSVV